ncbi:MAG: hypothetical protein V1779_04825 [bacterium]
MQKLFKTLLSISVIAVFLGMVLVNTGCEGPQGPAGLAGADGNGTCGTCHSETADDVNLKFAQYDLSQHNMGIVYEEEAGRITCGGCHSGDGFAEAAALGQDDANSVATSKINCKACHTIHQDYAMSDFGLRINAGYAMRINGTQIDLGKGNLCAKCHQGRAYTRAPFDSAGTQYETISPSGTSSYSRFGPHYGTPANVYVMNGPVQVGSTPFPTSNPHKGGTLFADGCVTCHMAKDEGTGTAYNPAVGGHTFRMPQANLSTIAACGNSGCHTAAEIKDASLYKSVAADIALYRRKLIDRGLLDTSQAVNEEFPRMAVLGEYFATPGGKKRAILKSDVDVVLNYLYVAKDRSNGIHNPNYIKAIVAAGLEYLQ